MIWQAGRPTCPVDDWARAWFGGDRRQADWRAPSLRSPLHVLAQAFSVHSVADPARDGAARAVRTSRALSRSEHTSFVRYLPGVVGADSHQNAASLIRIPRQTCWFVVD